VIFFITLSVSIGARRDPGSACKRDPSAAVSSDVGSGSFSTKRTGPPV
jgi:hypothetical protein